MMTVKRNNSGPGAAPRRFLSALIIAAGAFMLMIPSLAMAQSIGASSAAGFGKSDEPINIESDTLEVNEKKKIATFIGDVVAVQGKMTLKSVKMVVYYREGADGANEVTKIDANDKVVIISNDQKTTGDVAHFDMLTDLVTVIGNVVVTQGGNVIKGNKLVINQATGLTRFFSDAKSKTSRVRGVFLPPKKKKKK